MIGTSSACDRGTRRHLYRPLYATRQKHRPYRSIVADMTPLIEALACSQFTTPWPGAKPCTSDEIIEQSVMSPAKAQAARGSRVLTGGRFGILGILFSLASACSRNADRLTSFPRRLFRLCVLAAGQLRGRSDLVARSCIRVGDFGVDALVTRRWRLNDSVLRREPDLFQGRTATLRPPRRSSRRYGTLTWRFSQLLGPKAKPMCQAIVPEL